MTDDERKAYERGWNDCREAIAKLVDVSAERPDAWDWRLLPGIIRGITLPTAPSAPTAPPAAESAAVATTPP